MTSFSKHIAWDKAVMRSVLNRVVVGTLAGLIATGTGTGFAQQAGQRHPAGLSSAAAAPGDNGLGVTTQAPVQQGPHTLFTLEGTTIHIWAPVQEPYSGSAYENLAGQPMRSGDAILTPGALGPE